MSERFSIDREIYLRSTNEHFFALVRPPFRRNSKNYLELKQESETVRHVEEGETQVFVLNRRNFGEVPDGQEAELIRFIGTIAEPLGIVLDVEDIVPINAHRGATRE